MDKHNQQTEKDALFVKQLMKQYRQYDQEEGGMAAYLPKVENLTIRSVVKLTEVEREQIINLFLRMIDRPLGDVQEIIDPSLICGVSIQSESHYFEMSGRQQLKKMKLAFDKEL